MSKISKLAVFVLMMGSLALPALAFSSAVRGPGLKASHAAGTHSDKRCEKCRRGADGKMECEPVTCP